MKLRRFGAPRHDETATPDSAAPEPQRLCPQCGSSISARAKTCAYCGADLIAIKKAEDAKAKQLQREKREEAALRPTRYIVVVITAIVVLLILALVVRGQQEAAQLALTPTVTRTPTRTATPTRTPRPTPTNANTPTPIPPIEYTVKSGDTPGAIADFYGISVNTLMTFNGLGPDDIIVIGQVLKIPVPTPKPTGAAAPTSTPSVSACESIYTVQDGDTLSDISVKLKVPLDVIQNVNGIADPSELQIGQQLVIPTCPTPTATPSPTINPNATPTPVPNYARVKLLTPLDRELIVGNGQPVVLQWLSSGILQSNELYSAEVVQVDGTQPSQSIRTRATSWRLPLDLFPPLSDPNRTFRWHVEIIRQVGTGSDGAPIYEVVSPLSQYSFDWLAAPPTPTLTSTPLPGAQ